MANFGSHEVLFLGPAVLWSEYFTRTPADYWPVLPFSLALLRLAILSFSCWVINFADRCIPPSLFTTYWFMNSLQVMLTVSSCQLSYDSSAWLRCQWSYPCKTGDEILSLAFRCVYKCWLISTAKRVSFRRKIIVVIRFFFKFYSV